MAFEEIGVEAVVAGMGPFRANASEYNSRILSMAGITRTASAGISALGQVAIGAERYLGQLAVDGLRLAAREALRFVESVISAAVQGTALSRSLSTLQEHVQGIARVQLAPFFDQFNSLLQRAAPAIESFAQFAAGALGNLASNALVWGENVVNQFAQGMWNAVGAVIDALASIASQVAYWLAPGSPPKILPDLTDWGRGAMQAYLDGWQTADFGTFTELSGTIESYLRSIAANEDTGLIPRILGTREAIAQAVAQVRETGQVTQATLNQIYAAAGATTAGMQAYVKSAFELEMANSQVAAAQAELNKVTKQYDDLLKPIDQKLGAIGEEQQRLVEDNRISQLKLVANDPNATASEKRQAQLEIERILAERQRRAMLAEASVAKDAAQDKLDAAQNAQDAAQQEFDARKAAMALQTEQNRLMKEQIALLERLAKAAAQPGPKPAAGGAKGGGGGVKPFSAGQFDWKSIIPDSIWDKLASLQAAFGAAWAAIVATLQPAIDAWNNQVVPAWNHLVNAILASLPAVYASIGRMVAFVVTEMGVVLPGVFANVAIVLDSLAHIWERHHDTIIAVVEAAFKIIFTTISVTLLLVSGLVAVIFNQIAGFLDAWSLLFTDGWQAAWDQVKLTLTDSWNIIVDTLSVALDAILAIVGQDTETFIRNWRGVWDLAHIIVMHIVDVIRTAIATWTAEIGRIIRTDMAAIQAFWGLAWDTLYTAASTVVENIRAAIDTKIAAAQLIISTFTGAVQTSWAAFWTSIQTAVATAVEAVRAGIDDKINAAKTLFESAMAAILTAISGPLTALGNLFQAARDFWEWLQNHTFHIDLPQLPGLPGPSAPSLAPAPAVAGGGSYSYTSAPQYNLAVNTGRSTDSVTREFAIMQVLAGVPA